MKLEKEFEIILELECLPYKVNAIYTPPEREVWRYGILDQAAAPDDVDLLDISLYGESLTQEQEDFLMFLMQSYGWGDFNSWLLEKGRRLFKENEEDNKIMQRVE